MDNERDIQQHKDLIEELHSTFIAKNTDYGNSFHDTFVEFGMISAVCRIMDKTNRLKGLVRTHRNMVDESMEDTLMDLANYALMTVMEIRHYNDAMVREIEGYEKSQHQNEEISENPPIDENNISFIENIDPSMLNNLVSMLGKK